MPNTVRQLLDLPDWQEWDNVRRSQARERLFEAHLRDDPQRLEFFEQQEPAKQAELIQAFQGRISEERPELFTVEVRPETVQVQQRQPQEILVGGEVMRTHGGRPRERVVPAETRPLYDPETEAFVSEFKKDPSILDWEAMDAETMFGYLGLLQQATPDMMRQIQPKVKAQAERILKERMLDWFPFAEEDIRRDPEAFGPKAKMFLNEFLHNFVSFAGGIALGPLGELENKFRENRLEYYRSLPENPEIQRRIEFEEKESEWLRLNDLMHPENRALARIARPETELFEGLGTALGWMGGLNAVFRGSIRALPAVPIRDPETGARILNQAGREVTRRAHWAVDPVSRSGLALGLGADAAAGAFYGPQYGPNWAAEAFGVEPTRLTTALEGSGTGLAIGTLMRAGSNARIMNQLRSMEEFSDIPRNLSNREFARRAAEKWADAWESQRRAAASQTRRSPRETESMGSEFVGDVAEGAARPAPRLATTAEAPTARPASTPEAPTGTPGARPETGPSVSAADAPGAPAASTGTTKPVFGERAVQQKGERMDVGMRADGVPDILNAIQDAAGGIRPPSKVSGAGGEYDGWDEIMSKGAARLLRGGGPDIDELPNILRPYGYNFDKGDEVLDAIRRATADRERIRVEMRHRIYEDKVQDALTENLGRAGPQQTNRAVAVQDLTVGDKFKVKGEDFEVRAIDPDSGEITVQDGTRLNLPADQVVFVDRGVIEAAPYRGDPADPFGQSPTEWLESQVALGKALPDKTLKELDLSPPEGFKKNKAGLWVPPKPVRDAVEVESISRSEGADPSFRLERATPEEIEAEAQRVAQQQQAAQQRQAIEEGQMRRLTGDSSDVGQGRLFQEDTDLFSGPAAETMAGARQADPGTQHHSGADRPRPNPFTTDRGQDRQWPNWVKDKPETKAGRKLVNSVRLDEAGKTVGVRSIAKFIDDALGVETRKLKSQVTRRNPAHYRPFAHTTVSGELNSQILFHEAGHGLFELMDARIPGFWDNWERQLLAMTGEPGSMASAQNTTEGVAEWLRRYIVSPTDMAGYPDLTQAVLSSLDEVAPGVGSALRDASRAYFQHSNRSISAQFRSFNSDIGAGPPSLTALRDWMTGEAGTRTYEGAHKLIARGHPVNRLDKAIFRSIIRNRKENDMTLMEAYQKARDVRARQTYPLRYAYQNLLRLQPEANHALRGTRSSKGLRVINPETGNFEYLTNYAFADIVKRVGPEHWDTFQTGGFALTALDRFLKRGLDYPGQLDGIGARELQEMVDQANQLVPNFMRHYRQVEDYFNKLQELKDFGGLKKPGEVQQMQAAYDFYWPQPRIGTRGGGGKGHDRISAGDFRARGSREAVRDLMEVAEERTQSALTSVYWNQMGNRIVNSMESIARDESLPFFVRREAGRVMFPLNTRSGVAATLNQDEGRAIVLEALQRTLGETIDPAQINLGWEFKDVFRRVEPNEINVVRLLRDGEPRFYQITDPVLFHMFASTERPGTIANIMGKAIGPTTANWKREKTQNVPFAAYSLVRDSFTGILFGEEVASLAPGANFVRGVFERFQRKYPQITQEGELLSRQLQTEHNFKARMKNSAVWNWMMEGMVDYRHPNPLVRSAANVLNPHNILNAAIYKPADFINTITFGRYISPFQEESAREGAAAFAKDRGLSDEAANYRYWISAGNFAEQPGLGDARVLARIAGFWNPMTQGIYQTVDRLTDPDPAVMFNTVGRLGWISALFAAAAVGNYQVMSERERKRQRERSIQDRMTNSDWFGLRVPFPYGLEGVAASSTYNAILDYMLSQDTTANERAQMRRLLSTRLFDVGSGIGMTTGPLGQAFLETKANYSFFFDRHIVSPWMQNLPAPEQRTLRTPEFYNRLGEWLNYSPAKLEYLVRSGLSMQLDETIKAADRIRNNEIRNMTDLPYVGRMFIREPEGFSARSVRRLEDLDTRIQYLDRILDQKGFNNLHDYQTWSPLELSPDIAALQIQVNEVRSLRQGLQNIRRISELANASLEWSREVEGEASDRWREQFENLRSQMVFAAQSSLSAHPEAPNLLENLIRQARDLPKPPPYQRQINLLKKQR